MGRSQIQIAPELNQETQFINDASRQPAGGVFLPASNYEDLNMPTYKLETIERIGGAAVHITAEVPEEITDPNPIVLAHGYCGAENAYDRLRNAFARNGKVAISYNSPRRQEKLAGQHPKHFNKPVKLLSQSVWAAMRGGHKIFDQNGIEVDDVYDLTGHSMGGRSSVLAAKHHPEYVRSVLLNEAAGLEPHGTVMMLGRLAVCARREAVLAPKGILAGSAEYILSNPLKTLAEGIAVSNCNIRDDVRALKELGIKTAIIVGQNDSLISYDQVVRHSGTDVADLFVTYSDPKAHHLWPQTNPVETAKAHTEALTLLHKPRSRRRIHQIAA